MYVSQRTNTTLSQLMGDMRRTARGKRARQPYAASRTTIDRTAFWSPLKNCVMITQKMVLWVLRHTKGWKAQDSRTIIRKPTKEETRFAGFRFPVVR